MASGRSTSVTAAKLIIPMAQNDGDKGSFNKRADKYCAWMGAVMMSVAASARGRCVNAK